MRGFYFNFSILTVSSLQSSMKVADVGLEPLHVRVISFMRTDSTKFIEFDGHYWFVEHKDLKACCAYDSLAGCQRLAKVLAKKLFVIGYFRL